MALPPAIAQRWADPAIWADDARHLLHEGIPEDAFTWHPLRQEVGNSKYQLPDAIEQI
ncbi:hypothetical protein [Achromobacter insolitus]|uniref:hypothetical protein n=1 Tax=Achromobacter insolitus TaxID=217204 RepID=UPI0020B78B16|nr:hypothetical protein [Achromobacter insolitus]